MMGHMVDILNFHCHTLRYDGNVSYAHDNGAKLECDIMIFVFYRIINIRWACDLTVQSYCDKVDDHGPRIASVISKTHHMFMIMVQSSSAECQPKLREIQVSLWLRNVQKMW
jgi:hypothetical protein